MRSLLLVLLIAPLSIVGQVLTPTMLTPLDPTLNETSALVVLNGEVWTLLDSENPNALYRLDPVTGAVLRTVTVSNASNVDWEELTADAEWLYIGDFGNNFGSRTDLRVYRVPLNELLDPTTTELVADTISFAYPLQTDFTPAYRANDWDLEAMVAVHDSLFLFSKNWVSNTSYLYALSATPGDHLALRRDTLTADGLVTGATFDPTNGAVALVGYSASTFRPFVWRLIGYPGHAFFQGTAERIALSLAMTQMEAIAWNGSDAVYLSNESNLLNRAHLWQMPLEVRPGIPEPAPGSPTLWPSPNDGRFILEVEAPAQLELFDTSGRRVREQPLRPGTNHIAINVPNGVYIVRTGSRNAVVRMTVVR
ncbi:MAG: T9SS type A sorting domain-containing protein [Flavobacteriales bacterium]|nr:T9SS type A sorting domain-containing protein [Flavobacteriales bacterium]